MTNITLKVPQSNNAAIPAIPASATPSLLRASRKAALPLGSGGALNVVTGAGVLAYDVTRDVGAVVVAELAGVVVEGVVDVDDIVGTDVVVMLVTSVAVVASGRVVEVVGTGRLVRLPSVPVEVPS